MIAGMDLNLLRIFDAIMAERSVTRAATLLHMTQPAVSNALNRLRHAIDDPLFVKTQGGVSPTQRAQLMWPVIRDALERIGDALHKNDFDPAVSGAEFLIAMSDYVASQAVHPLFFAQQLIAPGVRIHLRSFAQETVATQLERGEIDMAAGVYTSFTPSLRTLPLETLQYVCALRKGHPLLQVENISIEQFLGARHLSVSLHGTAALIDRELAAFGFQRNTFLTVNQFSLVPELLAKSDLISIVPVATVSNAPDGDQLAVLDCPFQFQPRTINLIWHERSDNLLAHRWMRDQIVSAVKSRNGAFAGTGWAGDIPADVPPGHHAD